MRDKELALNIIATIEEILSKKVCKAHFFQLIRGLT